MLKKFHEIINSFLFVVIYSFCFSETKIWGHLKFVEPILKLYYLKSILFELRANDLKTGERIFFRTDCVVLVGI